MVEEVAIRIIEDLEKSGYREDWLGKKRLAVVDAVVAEL